MNNKERKAILDERGVNYDPKAKADELDALIAASEIRDEAPLVGEAPADESPEPADVGQEGVVAEAPAPQSYATGTLPITRIQPNGAWTCPFCDHAISSVETTCGKCGSRREGGSADR